MTNSNGRKSVILFTVDCLRADHVGCYGYDRPTTPNIDALVDQNNCIRFEFSYSNAPGTAWAFQSMLMGVWATQVGGVEGMGLPESGGRTIAEQFREAGYRTAGFANNGFVSRDHHADRGFDTFVGVKQYSVEEHPFMRWGKRIDKTLGNQRIRETVLKPIHTVLQTRSGDTTDDGSYRQRVTDVDVCNDAIEWIREREEHDELYFAWIHLMDAHTPYSRWDEHLRELRGDTNVKHVVDPINDVQVGEEPPEYVVDAYDAGIRSADEQIGRVLNEISDEATVAITGDHGEEFGRYGNFHNLSLHSSMTQVPLLIRASEFEDVSGERSISQHIDIPSTLVHLNDIEPHQTWVGKSLIEEQREEDSEIVFCLSTHKGMRVGEWKYIESPEYADGLLYHAQHGCSDGENVSVEYPDRRDELKQKIDSHEEWMMDHQIVSGTAVDNELSNAVEDNLRELGYLEN